MLTPPVTAVVKLLIWPTCCGPGDSVNRLGTKTPATLPVVQLAGPELTPLLPALKMEPRPNTFGGVAAVMVLGQVVMSLPWVPAPVAPGPPVNHQSGTWPDPCWTMTSVTGQAPTPKPAGILELQPALELVPMFGPKSGLLASAEVT